MRQRNRKPGTRIEVEGPTLSDFLFHTPRYRQQILDRLKVYGYEGDEAQGMLRDCIGWVAARWPNWLNTGVRESVATRMLQESEDYLRKTGLPLDEHERRTVSIDTVMKRLENKVKHRAGLKKTNRHGGLDLIKQRSRLNSRFPPISDLDDLPENRSTDDLRWKRNEQWRRAMIDIVDTKADLEDARVWKLVWLKGFTQEEAGEVLGFCKKKVGERYNKVWDIIWTFFKI